MKECYASTQALLISNVPGGRGEYISSHNILKYISANMVHVFYLCQFSIVIAKTN